MKMQIFILCNNLGLLIYGLLFMSFCHAGRVFGKWDFPIFSLTSFSVFLFFPFSSFLFVCRFILFLFSLLFLVSPVSHFSILPPSCILQLCIYLCCFHFKWGFISEYSNANNQILSFPYVLLLRIRIYFEILFSGENWNLRFMKKDANVGGDIAICVKS